MQRPAKPSTPVRFRLPPPSIKSISTAAFLRIAPSVTCGCLDVPRLRSHLKLGQCKQGRWRLASSCLSFRRTRTENSCEKQESREYASSVMDFDGVKIRHAGLAMKCSQTGFRSAWAGVSAHHGVTYDAQTQPRFCFARSRAKFTSWHSMPAGLVSMRLFRHLPVTPLKL